MNAENCQEVTVDYPLLLVRLRPIQLRNPRINLTDALSSIIKAFQNPIWAEQAKERLKQINILTRAATV